MKTFLDLIQEVQEPGLCRRCGGCVTFCKAINYGALKLDEGGKPVYENKDKCIDCGLCYVICPEIEELEEDVKDLVNWSPPFGRMAETTVVRAKDEYIRARATDGGAVTAILLHLLETGKIDNAIVTRQINPFQREPFLATSKEDIISSAGFHFDTSQTMKPSSDQYLTFSSVEILEYLMSRGSGRTAFVGTPCQIKSIRKMQTLGIVPSDEIKYCLGLFCSGNFIFGERQRQKLAEIGAFSWDEVVKLNIKDHFQVHLKTGEVRTIPLDELEFMKREACYFCLEYSAEFADISFGGAGSEEGWTTVIPRTKLGQDIFFEARGDSLEEFPRNHNPAFSRQALEQVYYWSEKKKKRALANRRSLGHYCVMI